MPFISKKDLETLRSHNDAFLQMERDLVKIAMHYNVRDIALAKRFLDTIAKARTLRLDDKTGE